jgi:hypothetical protein
MRKTNLKDNSDIQHIDKNCRILILPSTVEEIELELDQPRVITIFGLGRNEENRQWHLKITNKGNLVLV